MKLVLLVVIAIAIFPTDSRGFPDKPDKRDFAAYQEVHFQSDSKTINNEPGFHKVVHNTKNFPDESGSNHSSIDKDLAYYIASLLSNGSQGLNFSEVVQQSLEERKEVYEEPLRGDSKNINNEPGVRNVVHNTKNFPDGSGSNHSSTDKDLAYYIASLLSNGSQGLNFSEVVQQSLEERKEVYEESLRGFCNDRTSYCQTLEIQGYCQFQAILDACPKSCGTCVPCVDKLSSCRDSANSGKCKDNPFMMNWCPKACDVCGGVLIGDTSSSAQFLTFHTEKGNIRSSKCQLLNARLAQLNNPHAFHTYAANKYRGESFWLAAWDYHHEGHWTWWWDSKPLTNFPWGPRQPNNYGGNQDCLEWGYGNNFNDANCDVNKRFVCEHASWKR